MNRTIWRDSLAYILLFFRLLRAPKIQPHYSMEDNETSGKTRPNYAPMTCNEANHERIDLAHRLGATKDELAELRHLLVNALANLPAGQPEPDWAVEARKVLGIAAPRRS